MVVHFTAKMPRKMHLLHMNVESSATVAVLVITSHGHRQDAVWKIEKGRRGSLTDGGSTEQVLEYVMLKIACFNYQ